MSQSFARYAAFILFGVISAYFHFSFYPLGSNEASLLLSKRPSIIEWNKVDLEKKQSIADYVVKDSFRNYSAHSDLLVRDPRSKPSLYLRTPESIWPLFMQSRTGAFPHLVNRMLARITGPGYSLGLFSWLCSLLSFTLAFFLIKWRSGKELYFAGLALLTPQMVYFLGPSYQDFHLSVVLVLGAMLATFRSERKWPVISGLLMGFALYVKLASGIFLPFVLFMNRERGLRALKEFLFAFLLPVILLMLMTDWSDLWKVIFRERDLTKGAGLHASIWKEFFFYLFVPQDIFPFIFKNVFDARPFSSWWSFITTGASFILAGILFVRHISRRDKAFLVLGTILYIFFVATISRSFYEDLFSYLSQGIYFFTVFFLFMLKESNKKIHYALLGLILLKVPSMIAWTGEFRKITSEFPGSAWIYEDMEKEIAPILGDEVLLTMNYLDVGQFEFYSKELITPVHVAWKFSDVPSPEKFYGLLEKLSADDIYVLQSYGEDGRDWKFYVKTNENEIRAHLRVMGIAVEDVKTFDYPGVGRSYRLIKLSRARLPAGT